MKESQYNLMLAFIKTMSAQAAAFSALRQKAADTVALHAVVMTAPEIRRKTWRKHRNIF